MLHAANKPSTENYQFSSLAQSCPTLCDPMNCSTPGLPVYHQPIYILKPKLKKQHRMMLTRSWGVEVGWCQGKGEMLFRCTNSYINKSWRSNVQYSEYRQQLCIITLKLAERLINFITPTTKKKN